MAQRRPLAAAILLAVSLLVAAAATRLLPDSFSNNPGNMEVECGELLLHGRPSRAVDVSYAMPLGSLASAELFGHAGPAASRALWAACWTALHALTFALAWSLAGPWAAWLSLPLLWPFEKLLLRYPINAVYALSLLLAAGVVVRRARAPTRANTAAAGLALGLSVLQRSPLALFPLALLAADAAELRSPRAALRRAWPAVVVPLALLLPWAAMNVRLHGGMTWLERGRMEGLVVGSVRAVDKNRVDPALFAGGGGLAAAAVSWAREAAASPGDYLRACAGRLMFMTRPFAASFALALLGLWLRRRRAEARALALLVGFYGVLHCLVVISEAYVVPLGPPLTALGAAAAAALLKKARDGSARARELAVSAFDACLALEAAAGLLALALAAVYPWRAAAAPAARPTTEPWLLVDDARRALAAGDAAAAAPLLARARAARPLDDRIALYHAWSQALAGYPEELLRLTPRPMVEPVPAIGLAVLRAGALQRAGHAQAARAEAAAAAAAWPPTGTFPTYRLDEFLSSLPPAEHATLLRSLLDAAKPRPLPDVALLLAELALRRGDARSARSYAQILRGLPLAPQEAARLAEVYERLRPRPAGFDVTRELDLARAALGDGDRAQAVKHLDAFADSDAPRKTLRLAVAEYWLACACERGDRLLRRLDGDAPAPPLEDARAFGLRYAASGDADCAQQLVARTALKRRDADGWLLAAEVALAARRRENAAEALARAAPLARTPDQRRRLADLLRSSDDERGACALTRRLAKESPRDARAREDAGVCAFEAGRAREAERELEAAIALSPSQLSAYLSLAAVRLSKKDRAGALSAYERALAAAKPGDPLESRVRAGRDELLER